MTQADQIREFVVRSCLAPTRARGLAEATVRAGDVHRDMRLSNAMPAVCSVLGGNKLEQLGHVKLLERTGPRAGSNVFFRFDLKDRPEERIASQPQADRSAPALNGRDPLDLKGAVALVSCVKSKLPHAAPARTLYTSAWFCKARDLVEARNARWYVLSSRYGLVLPEMKIAPYEYTLNTLGVAERRKWAARVLDALLPLIPDEKRIVMFAGHRYREFLMGPLARRGIDVEVPMANLTRGQQLAWLNTHG